MLKLNSGKEGKHGFQWFLRMKILAVTKTQGRAKDFVKTGLNYITRAGYDYKIYLHERERKEYEDELAFAKSDYYLYIRPESIIYIDKASNIYQESVSQRIKLEAKEEGYDLILFIPEDLYKLGEIRKFDDRLLYFCREINAMRARFSEDKDLRILSSAIDRYIYMVRL